MATLAKLLGWDFGGLVAIDACYSAGSDSDSAITSKPGSLLTCPIGVNTPENLRLRGTTSRSGPVSTSVAVPISAGRSPGRSRPAEGSAGAGGVVGLGLNRSFEPKIITLREFFRGGRYIEWRILR